MNEFGEEIAFYVWPTDREEGEPYPDDFYERVRSALATVALGCEVV